MRWQAMFSALETTVFKVFQQVQMVFVLGITQLVFGCLRLERAFLLAPAAYVLHQCDGIYSNS